ncbi:ABC transporter permease [Bacteroidota bacterium]
MIWSISWRNVWRNRVRSLVIIIAVTVGIFAGAFSIAFMVGWMNQRVDAAVKTEVSHIQIHHPDYIKTNDIQDFIPNSSGIINEITNNKNVEAISDRMIINSMIASAETGSGIQIIGIDPETESKVTDLHEKLIEGKYLEGAKRNPIVIGEKLAEKLNVKLRSKVIITAQHTDGSITAAAFKVTGIFKTVNSMYDEMKVFVRKKDLANFVGLPESTCHEIAILLNDNDTETTLAEEFRNKYKDVEVLTYKQLMPDLELMTESMDFSMYIFVAIILLGLGFAIINTMLMAVLERIKELGMLMAIGMNKIRVFFMIVLETVFLSLIGGVVGVIVAFIISQLTNKTGIDLSIWAEGLNAFGYDSIIYPVLTWDVGLNITILVIIVGILASLYPAFKALKLHPADALRTDN